MLEAPLAAVRQVEVTVHRGRPNQASEQRHVQRRTHTLVAYVADDQRHPTRRRKHEDIVEIAGHIPGRLEKSRNVKALDLRNGGWQEVGLDLATDLQLFLVPHQALGARSNIFDDAALALQHGLQYTLESLGVVAQCIEQHVPLDSQQAAVFRSCHGRAANLLVKHGHLAKELTRPQLGQRHLAVVHSHPASFDDVHGVPGLSRRNHRSARRYSFYNCAGRQLLQDGRGRRRQKAAVSEQWDAFVNRQHGRQFI
jgi:hypothetical protein